MHHFTALSNLHTLRGILNKYNAHWWLEAGTCLGVVREQDFIGHDNDTDIGILSEDFQWEMLTDFVEHGFEVRQIFGMRHVGLELALYRGGVKTDIFLFYRKDDKRWHAAWNNGGRNGMSDIIKLVFPADIIEKKQLVEFKGLEFPIPFDEKKYLELRYGDWKTENKKWNWATDPLCIDNAFEI